MPSYPGFLGGTNRSQSYIADDEILDNLYLEPNPPTAPTPGTLMNCPGFNAVATVATAPARGNGMFYQRGRAFFIAGVGFYELLSDLSVLLWDTVENDGNPVTINANGDAGNQLWITSGGVGYIFDLLTNTLSVEGVVDTTVSMGGYLAARFLYLDANTGAFYASAQYDGTSWDPTFVAQSQSGDPWRALIVTPDALIRLLGESSGEAWADQGALPFPFSQMANANIEYGIVAPFAWSVNTTITWLAQNKQGRGIVVRAPGYAPERISTFAIEAEIQTFADLLLTTAWSYQENGHIFTVFTFPNDERTFVYDETTGLWHTRSYWDIASADEKAYRPACMMEAFGKILVGDRLSGTIYEMNSRFYREVDQGPIRKTRQPPRFSVEQKLCTVDSLELVMDVGNGLVDDQQGHDPVVMWQMSRDGGKTFSQESWAPIGALGNYETRVRWTQCGQARNRVDRFVVSDSIGVRMSDLVMTYRVGQN